MDNLGKRDSGNLCQRTSRMGLEGMRFWLQDRSFYKLLKDGIHTPFVWRVFNGKRKKWDGARVGIEKVNRGVVEMRWSKKVD